jgi:CRP/FNR family transcriptional regulator
MTVDKIAALKRTSLFGSLDDDALKLLAERALERHYKKDEVIFVAGEEATGMYVIVDGAVRAFRMSSDGREQVIHVERAGATIAEVPLFDDGTYPSNVAAEETTTLLFLAKRDVQRLFLQQPQIALVALKVMAGRLRRCAELVEALSLKEVGQRLARFLLAEARRSGTRTDRGISLQLTQTNQQIAARIGSVREVVSRAFTRLQHDKLIHVDGRNLLILDEEALESFAGQQ